MVANYSVSCKSVVSQSNIGYHYLSAPTEDSLLDDWRLAATGYSVGVCFWGDGMGGKRKTPSDHVALANLRGFEWLGPEVPHGNIKTNWKCSKGHVWKADYGHIKDGTGCPYCSGQAKKTPDDYSKVADFIDGKWLGPEVNNTSHYTWWQCIKGHKWEAPYHTVSRGHGCPHCAGIIRKTPSEYHDLASQRDLEWQGKEVKNTNIKTHWKCKNGHIIYMSYTHVRVNLGCPTCRKVSPLDYHNLASSRSFNWIGPQPSNVNYRTTWQCEKGHRWQASYSNIRNGTGCPSCQKSWGAERVAKFLRDNNIICQREKKFDKCRYIKPLEFDFFFVINEQTFLVEYDGRQHFEPVDMFGGEKALKGVQHRDAIKTKFAQDNGLILIRISYKVENIEAYLQFELEKYLPFSIDQLNDQPERPQTKIKPINPYQWQQGTLFNE